MPHLHREQEEGITIKKKDYGTGIPRHEIEALALCLLPDIQEFFESEEGQREFAEWKRQQKIFLKQNNEEDITK